MPSSAHPTDPLSALTSELDKERSRTRDLNSELSRKTRGKRLDGLNATSTIKQPAVERPGLGSALSQYIGDRMYKLNNTQQGAHPKLALKASERALGKCSPKVLVIAQKLFAQTEKELVSGPEPIDEDDDASTKGEAEVEMLRAALRDMAARLEEQDRCAAQSNGDQDGMIQMLQDGLVRLAEENVALQARLVDLEHIALAAALSPMATPLSSINELSPFSIATPPESPQLSPTNNVKHPNYDDSDFVTPPSPSKSSRRDIWGPTKGAKLDFSKEESLDHCTPDAPTSKAVRETPEKMSRLDLKQKQSGSHLDKVVNEAMKDVVGMIESPRTITLTRKKRLSFSTD